MTKLNGLDFETRSEVDVTQVGSYVYAQHPSTEVLVVSVKFHDQEPVALAAPDWGGDPEAWEDLRNEVRARMRAGELFVAANSGFDRNIHWFVYDPQIANSMERDHHLRLWICCLALARRCTLPGNVGALARVLNADTQKDERGKYLIRALSNGNAPRPDNWRQLMEEMISYGLDDTRAMMQCIPHMLPYSREQWEAFWASEKVNDTGIPIDRTLCMAATELANESTEEINEKLQEITGLRPEFGPKGGQKSKGMTLGNHVLKAKWMAEQLEPFPDLVGAMTTEKDAEGNPIKFSLDEHARNQIAEALEGDLADELPTPVFDAVSAFLEALDEGQGAAQAKFRAMVQRCSDDGRLRGAYLFDGAGATGRWSSKGAQLHNLVNQTIPCLVEVVETICSNASNKEKAERLRDLTGLGLATTLGRCVRPAICAPPGRVLLWADYAGVEARGLPWLANNPGGDQRLERFQTGFDFYCDIASKIYGREIVKGRDALERNVGKGIELGSGFGGGVGAAKRTFKKFGVKGIPNETIREWVYLWRDENPWCVRFWDEIKQAVRLALQAPGRWTEAGRLRYAFIPGLLGGSLLCELPSGRHLVYPFFKRSFVIEKTEDGRDVRREVFTCRRFRKGVMRVVRLWHGTFVENATQAMCNDLLREALARAVFDMDWAGNAVVIGTTHDEMIVECDFDARDEVAEQLKEIMSTTPAWAEGFPLVCSVDIGTRYEKKD